MHLSLSCPLIEWVNFQLVRQIAGAKFAQKWLNDGLISWSGLLPYLSCKVAQIASQAETRRSISFSVRGAGFPQKRCGRQSPEFAGDQPNAMLALSAEERIFLSAFILPMVTEWPLHSTGRFVQIKEKTYSLGMCRVCVLSLKKFYEGESRD